MMMTPQINTKARLLLLPTHYTYLPQKTPTFMHTYKEAVYRVGLGHTYTKTSIFLVTSPKTAMQDTSFSSFNL